MDLPFWFWMAMGPAEISVGFRGEIVSNELRATCDGTPPGASRTPRRAVPTIEDALAESRFIGKRVKFPGWKSNHHRPFPSFHRCDGLQYH